MTDLPLIEDLNHLQADGFACVICRFDYLTGPPRPAIPVGRSVTSPQVFACAGSCAGQAGFRPDAGWRQDVLS